MKKNLSSLCVTYEQSEKGMKFNMNYLFIAAYAAPYTGNFINSIERLEKKLRDNGDKVIYAFNDKAEKCDWIDKLKSRTKVYFLPTEKARMRISTYIRIKRIIKLEKINVIHSHFELYDIPARIVANKKVKVFWHLHDVPNWKNMDFLHKMINKLQYRFLGKNVKLITINEYYKNHISNVGMSKKNIYVVPNGIDTKRILFINNNRKINYDFYTMGWDYYRKGIDIILKACQKLSDDGYVFKLLLNGNDNTWNELAKVYKKIPNWLEKQEFVENINDTIGQVGCFIQASRNETFSYAIGEMSYAGLKVFSSEIEGTKWAKEIPLVSFFKNENSEELYELMKNYLKNTIKTDNYYIQRNSRDVIENKYSVEKWVDRIIKLYGGNL